MSFDKDQTAQAQISGSDFAQMCDEMTFLIADNTRLRDAGEKMADALKCVLDWDEHAGVRVSFHDCVDKTNDALTEWNEVRK